MKIPEIPLIKPTDILDIKLTNNFNDHDVNYKEGDNKSFIELTIELGRWGDDMQHIPIFDETYDYYETIIYKAVNNIDGLECDVNVVDGTFTLDKTSLPDKEQISNLITTLNREIKKSIEKDFNIGVGQFIESKHKELQDNLLDSYEFGIVKSFNKIVMDKFSGFDRAIIFSLDVMPVKYDLSQNEYKRNMQPLFGLELPIRKISDSPKYLWGDEHYKDYKYRQSNYDKIKVSPLVDEVIYIGNEYSNNIQLKGSKIAENFVIENLRKATNSFYNKPLYKSHDIAPKLSFFGRVNNGKGMDADVWADSRGTKNSIQLVLNENNPLSNNPTSNDINELVDNSFEMIKADNKTKKILNRNKPR
jgi:hypothetical protein